MVLGAERLQSRLVLLVRDNLSILYLVSNLSFGLYVFVHCAGRRRCGWGRFGLNVCCLAMEYSDGLFVPMTCVFSFIALCVLIGLGVLAVSFGQMWYASFALCSLGVDYMVPLCLLFHGTDIMLFHTRDGRSCISVSVCWIEGARALKPYRIHDA